MPYLHKNRRARLDAGFTRQPGKCLISRRVIEPPERDSELASHAMQETTGGGLNEGGLAARYRHIITALISTSLYFLTLQ